MALWTRSVRQASNCGREVDMVSMRCGAEVGIVDLVSEADKQPWKRGRCGIVEAWSRS